MDEPSFLQDSPPYIPRIPIQRIPVYKKIQNSYIFISK